MPKGKKNGTRWALGAGKVENYEVLIANQLGLT